MCDELEVIGIEVAFPALARLPAPRVPTLMLFVPPLQGRQHGTVAVVRVPESTGFRALVRHLCREHVGCDAAPAVEPTGNLRTGPGPTIEPAAAKHIAAKCRPKIRSVVKQHVRLFDARDQPGHERVGMTGQQEAERLDLFGVRLAGVVVAERTEHLWRGDPELRHGHVVSPGWEPQHALAEAVAAYHPIPGVHDPSAVARRLARVDTAGYLFHLLSRHIGHGRIVPGRFAGFAYRVARIEDVPQPVLRDLAVQQR